MSVNQRVPVKKRDQPIKVIHRTDTVRYEWHQRGGEIYRHSKGAKAQDIPGTEIGIAKTREEANQVVQDHVKLSALRAENFRRSVAESKE